MNEKVCPGTHRWLIDAIANALSLTLWPFALSHRIDRICRIFCKSKYLLQFLSDGRSSSSWWSRTAAVSSRDWWWYATKPSNAALHCKQGQLSQCFRKVSAEKLALNCRFVSIHRGLVMPYGGIKLGWFIGPWEIWKQFWKCDFRTCFADVYL